MGTLIRLDDYPVWPVLSLLLKDKTMKRNIIWATASYASLGEYYADSAQMTENALRDMGRDSIQPRILKAQEEQQKRTRAHAEVFTPAWICCQMNNHLDEEWFGRKDVFNVQRDREWTPTEGHITFPKHKHASWKLYVDSRRLEITCGEAPFIVSRYDAATGKEIPIERRIGLLDRKLRIVDENANGEQEWVKWAIRAIQSVYGYEYQGDNLLIARINVLMTFAEYMEALWRRKPTEKELKTVANIIAWNFWQMDGLTGTVPKGKLQAPEPEVKPITMEELGWFAGIDGGKAPTQSAEQDTTPPCRVCNWRQTHTVTFDSLKTHRGRDVRNMKFDFVIGNPPYQEESSGDSTGTNPVYHHFIDGATEIGDYVELITPARFLFNAGKTPKAWNEKMLSDRHFKVLMYSQDPNKVFPGVPITGGVAVSCWNANDDHDPIGTFVPYDALRSVIAKVRGYNGFTPIRNIIYVHSKFDLEKVFALNENYRSMIGSEGRDRRVRANAMEKFDFFTEEKKSATDVRVLGLVQNKRAYRYVKRELLESAVWVDKYKVFVPESNGASGMLGEEAARIISKPVCGVPGEGVTQTFIVVGSMDTQIEAENLHKYILSKFSRVLLGSLKATQRNNSDTWENVPLQDFTPASDIDWAQPIHAIDQQLYRKYGLTDEEIAFIESHVKEMT